MRGASSCDWPSRRGPLQDVPQPPKDVGVAISRGGKGDKERAVADPRRYHHSPSGSNGGAARGLEEGHRGYERSLSTRWLFRTTSRPTRGPDAVTTRETPSDPRFESAPPRSRRVPSDLESLMSSFDRTPRPVLAEVIGPPPYLQYLDSSMPDRSPSAWRRGSARTPPAGLLPSTGRRCYCPWRWFRSAIQQCDPFC